MTAVCDRCAGSGGRHWNWCPVKPADAPGMGPFGGDAIHADGDTVKTLICLLDPRALEEIRKIVREEVRLAVYGNKDIKLKLKDGTVE